MNPRHPASLYNEVRHHAFSLFHKDLNIDINQILNIIEKEHDPLPQKAKIGLLRELKFYKKYRKQYSLTPTLDCGDKSDFVGKINNKMGRIDVTSSLEFKKLDDYNKPIAISEENYFLALVKEDGSLDEMINLNVPIVEKDGEVGRLIDLVILMPSDGCSKYNPYQEIITIDTIKHTVLRRQVITDWYIEDFATLMTNIPDYVNEIDFIKEIQNHGSQTARFLSKNYGYNIMGSLSYEYQILSPDGDGEYGYFFRWVHPLFEKLGYKYSDEFFSEDLS